MIEQVLNSLGITCNYVGYRQTILAIQLALEDETRLCAVTRKIYWVIADMLPCTRCAVEKNIRTVIFCAWKINKQLLINIAGFPLTAPPSVSQFLAIIVAYLNHSKND